MPTWPLTLAIVAIPATAGAHVLESHDLRGTFVSADARTSTLRVALDDGSTTSRFAEGDAARMLARLRAGDRVRITCRADGTRVAVTAITVVR